MGDEHAGVPIALPASERAPAAEVILDHLLRVGFVPGVVPELAPLLPHCSAVLIKADGLVFTSVAILDADQHPERTWGLTPQEIAAMARACGRYTGSMNGVKIPAGLTLYEVRGTVAPEDVTRAASYGHRSREAHVGMFEVDALRSVVAPKPLLPLPLWLRLRKIEQILRGPRQLTPLPPPEEVIAPPDRRPVVTTALVAGLLGIFGLEQVLTVAPSEGWLTPSIQTLVGLGGLSRDLVLSGEWYRVLAAMFLHGSLVHVGLNCVALFMAGAVLETVVGRAWLVALFFLGGIGGGFMSMAVNEPNVVSVGASGAIMGLLAAGLAVSGRLPAGVTRVEVQTGLMRILIPSLLPLATVHTGEHVDFGAHLGGAIVGGLVGLVLLRLWKRGSADAPWPKVGWGVALAGALACVVAAPRAAAGYSDARLEMAMIPDGLIDQHPDPEQLVRDYPRDPRSHAQRGLARLKNDDLSGAEAEFRAALSEKRALGIFFADGRFERAVEAELALSVDGQGRGAEAKDIARKPCASGDANTRAELQEAGLCP